MNSIKNQVYRENKILLLIDSVLDIRAEYDPNNRIAHYCPICGEEAPIKMSDPSMADIKHEDDCAYKIAVDLKGLK